MNLAETIVSEFGKPRPTFGWSDFALLMLLVVVVVGAEALVGEAIRAIGRRAFRQIKDAYDRANRKKPPER